MSATPDVTAAADEEIVRRVQRGEKRLFSLLFDRYYTRLERFARQQGVPESDLDDVIAEVFTRAFSRIASFDAESGTRYVSYLYAIARNLITDRLRARGRSREVAWPAEGDPRGEALTDGFAPVEVLLRREQVNEIRRAMERLSPSDREIITLSYDRELSCREIMGIMGKPSVTSVTTHLYKAMKRLRELVIDAEVAAGSR